MQILLSLRELYPPLPCWLSVSQNQHGAFLGIAHLIFLMPQIQLLFLHFLNAAFLQTNKTVAIRLMVNTFTMRLFVLKLWLQCSSQGEQMLRQLTLKCKITTTKKHVMCIKYTPVTQSQPCLIFFMCVATIYHKTTVDKNLKINLHFMIITYLWPWNKLKVIYRDMNC